MQRKIKRRLDVGQFFDFCDDLSLRNRWLLDHPDVTENDDDTWFRLKLGIPLELQSPVRIVVSKDGRPMDVNLTSLANLVLSERAARLLQELAPDEAQYFDAAIEDDRVG